MEDALVDLKQTAAARCGDRSGAGNAGSRYIVDHTVTPAARRRSKAAINHLNKECND